MQASQLTQGQPPCQNQFRVRAGECVAGIVAWQDPHAIPAQRWIRLNKWWLYGTSRRELINHSFLEIFPKSWRQRSRSLTWKLKFWSPHGCPIPDTVNPVNIISKIWCASHRAGFYFGYNTKVYGLPQKSEQCHAICYWSPCCFNTRRIWKPKLFALHRKDSLFSEVWIAW